MLYISGAAGMMAMAVSTTRTPPQPGEVSSRTPGAGDLGVEKVGRAVPRRLATDHL